MQYFKKSFSVPLTSKDYLDNWEAVFRPVSLERRLADGSWEVISRHRTIEEATAEIVERADGAVYRAVEGPAS